MLCTVFSIESVLTFLAIQMLCEQRSIARINAAILYRAEVVVRRIAMLLKTQVLFLRI